MDFDQLNKKFSQSFNSQKRQLKTILAGKEVLCETCNQLIQVTFDDDSKTAVATCKQGCTRIELETN